MSRFRKCLELTCSCCLGTSVQIVAYSGETLVRRHWVVNERLAFELQVMEMQERDVAYSGVNFLQIEGNPLCSFYQKEEFDHPCMLQTKTSLL